MFVVVVFVVFEYTLSFRYSGPCYIGGQLENAIAALTNGDYKNVVSNYDFRVQFAAK